MSNRENTTADENKTIAEVLKGAREFMQRIYDEDDNEFAYEITGEDEAEVTKLLQLLDEWGLTVGVL
jgi:hypothetical protein